MRPAPQRRRAGESCNPPFVRSKLMPKRAAQPHFTVPPKTQRSRRSLRGTEKYPNSLHQHHYTPWGSVPVALPRSPLLLPSSPLTPSLGSRLGATAGSGGRRGHARTAAALSAGRSRPAARPAARPSPQHQLPAGARPAPPACPMGPRPRSASLLTARSWRGAGSPYKAPGACSGQSSSAAWRRGHSAGPGTSRPVSAAPRS